MGVIPRFIQASYKQTNTIWLFPGPVSANLDLIVKRNDQSTNRKRWLVNEAVMDTFKSHVPREDSAIRDEASDGYLDVVADLKNYLLCLMAFMVYPA